VRSRTFFCAMLISVSWILAWPPSALPDETLIAGAKKEGQVSLYLSTNLTDANGMIQLFRQKYPFINVGLFRAENEKLLNRILTEASAGKFSADVILISSFEARVLMQKKLLQKYVSPESFYYPEGFTDKEGYWTSVYSIPRVVAYNTKLVRPDAVPKTYEDLLQPRWIGQVLRLSIACLYGVVGGGWALSVPLAQKGNSYHSIF